MGNKAQIQQKNRNESSEGRKRRGMRSVEGGGGFELKRESTTGRGSTYSLTKRQVGKNTGKREGGSEKTPMERRWECKGEKA